MANVSGRGRGGLDWTLRQISAAMKKNVGKKPQTTSGGVTALAFTTK